MENDWNVFGVVKWCPSVPPPFLSHQEEARCVRQEPCASLTPTTWRASYRGRGRGEGLRWDHEEEAFLWSPSYTRWGVTPV